MNELHSAYEVFDITLPLSKYCSMTVYKVFNAGLVGVQMFFKVLSLMA